MKCGACINKDIQHYWRFPFCVAWQSASGAPASDRLMVLHQGRDAPNKRLSPNSRAPAMQIATDRAVPLVCSGQPDPAFCRATLSVLGQGSLPTDGAAVSMDLRPTMSRTTSLSGG